MRRFAAGLALALALVASSAVADDDAGAKEWRETIALYQKQLDAVNEADRNLTQFSTTKKLTAKGKGAVKAAAAKLDDARQQLQTSLDAANLLSKRKTAADDAIRFRSSNTASLSAGAEAVQKEKSAEGDDTLVDHTEEEAAARKAAAERARAEQDAARRDAEEKRKAEEERRKADAEARRQDQEAKQKEAEAKRQADADARKQADEAKRAAAAAEAAAAATRAAQAEAKERADVDARVQALAKAVQSQSDRTRETTGELGTFLARPNLTIDARTNGMRAQQRAEGAASSLRALEKKVDALRSMSVKSAQASLAGVQGEVERSSKEVVSLVEASRSLVSSSKSYLTGLVPAPEPVARTASPEAATPAAPVKVHRTEDVIPVCEFAFEPSGPDAKGASLSIDGGGFRPLPYRARLASGRHTLGIKRDKTQQERRELLLCGHIAVVPIELEK